MLSLCQKAYRGLQKYITKMLTINTLLHRCNFLATSQSQAFKQALEHKISIIMEN